MRFFTFLIGVILLFTGCSSKVLLPYEDEALCKRGANEGMCGSVSEVYKATTRINYGD